MSGSPFASSGVTAVDIQEIQKRLTDIEKKMEDGFTSLSNKIATMSATKIEPPVEAPKVAPSALDSVLPATAQPQVDLSSIFPKEGGGSKKRTRRKRNARNRKNKV